MKSIKIWREFLRNWTISTVHPVVAPQAVGPPEQGLKHWVKPQVATQRRIWVNCCSLTEFTKFRFRTLRRWQGGVRRTIFDILYLPIARAAKAPCLIQWEIGIRSQMMMNMAIALRIIWRALSLDVRWCSLWYDDTVFFYDKMRHHMLEWHGASHLVVSCFLENMLLATVKCEHDRLQLTSGLLTSF